MCEILIDECEKVKKNCFLKKVRKSPLFAFKYYEIRNQLEIWHFLIFFGAKVVLGGGASDYPIKLSPRTAWGDHDWISILFFFTENF